MQGLRQLHGQIKEGDAAPNMAPKSLTAQDLYSHPEWAGVRAVRRYCTSASRRFPRSSPEPL